MTTSEAVPVPDELREGLEARWVGCRKIRIESQVRDNQWTSHGLNSLALTCEPNGLPEEDIDETSEELISRIAKHYVRNGSEPQWYRIVCYCVVVQGGRNGGKPKEKRNSFKLRYEGDAGITDTETSDALVDNQIALEEMRNELLAQTKGLVDDLHVHLQESHKVIVSQGSQIKLIAEPMGHAVELAKSMWITGITLQQDALKRQFDENRLRQEREESRERWAEAMRFLGPAIELATAGMLQWATRKMGGNMPDLVAQKANQRARTEAQEADDTANGDEGDAADLKPTLRTFTRRFADFMTPAQHVRLVDELTKKELRLLYSMLETDDEDTIAALYTEIAGGGIPTAKLIVLNQILDTDQQRCFLALRQLVQARSAADA